MNKRLIVIDDSGDPGFKEGSSSNFVIAAALFMDLNVAQSLSETIALYRKELGWRNEYEFKFTKIRKDIIVDLLKIVSHYDFRIYATYINKESFRDINGANSSLYNWTIKELLLEMPISESKIEIDGRSNRQNARRTATYLRRELSNKTIKTEFSFQDSAKDNLIQLADLIAGSINRSFTDKTDANRYISILRKKICLLKRIDIK